MAADQRKKRLNGASIVGGSSRDYYRSKKKNSRFPQNVNLASHISLEWDGNQKRIVAKREQIGISRRDLRPLINAVPHGHNILADVTSVPQETFDLENLNDVLSYEVWQTHLSENERNQLMQFLPTGQETQQVVQALLAGDNFHFGSPFLKWGASICSGQRHPDAVLCQELQLKADRKAYYSELHKYHNDIVEYLSKLKESWESCKDPDMEIVLKQWRHRNSVEKIISSHTKEFRFRDIEENVAVTSESSSWAADEKACSSDNQISSVLKCRGNQKRRVDKSFIKDKSRNSLIASDDMLNVGAQTSKGDKLLKCNINCTDGAKYMSYVKVSKKQHELYKSMKQSGKSIQSRSLHRLLGNINNFNIQPYEVFVEEEQEKLHDKWLQLANQDLRSAYANWRGTQLQRRRMINSLGNDLKEKLNSSKEDDEKEDSMQERMDVQTTAQEFNMEDDKESAPSSSLNQSPQKLSSLDGGHEDPMVIDSYNNNVLPESDDAPRNESEYSRNLHTVDVTISEGHPLPSGARVWPADGNGIPHSFYDSATSHEYAAASGLSLASYPQVNDKQRALLNDLESNLRQQAGKDVLHGEPNDVSFSSYQNQDRNELLNSLFKDQVMTSYHHEHKQTGLDFMPTNNVLRENGQFPGHFQDQSHLSMTLEQERQNAIYMQQNMSGNIYSDGGRYIIPRQEHLTPVNLPDWAVNPLRVSTSLQPHLKGGEMLSQNWFSSNHQVRGGWAGSDGTVVPTQGIGSGNNADQSLFSALSHCNSLESTIPYQSMGSTEQFISPRNYGMVGEGTSRMNNVLPHTAHQLDYLSGRAPATSMMTDEMVWMTLPHQNTALHDSIGKPLLRPWNQ